MADNYEGKNVDANEINRAYLDSILIEQRILDSLMPDIHMTVFGETFDTPIMTPAFSHLKVFGEGRPHGMVEYAQAAKNLNALNWVGMEPDDLMGEILDVGAKTIRIIKPFADKDEILRQMAFAEEHGAFAVGVDIDHAYGYDGKYDVVDGIEMKPVLQEDIKRYKAATKLPFLIKGVLSVRDAVKCAACGVNGIVVSSHHGRLPYGIPPLKVLPEIADALADTGITIFADCHIDSGVDAFKALALGARGVSVGRAMMQPLVQGGVSGVEEKIRKMGEELITVMGYTNSPTIDAIDPSVLWVEE